MHRRRFVFAVAFPIFFAACAGGPPPEPPGPPPLDPAGTWDLQLELDGMGTFDAVMFVSGSEEEGYSADIESAMGTASVGNFTVEGQVLSFSIPDISGTVTLTFDGEELSGSMDSEMGAAFITATKRTGG